MIERTAAPIRYFSPALLCLLWLGLIFTPAHTLAECDDAARDAINAQQQKLQSVSASHTRLNQLFAGQLTESFDLSRHIPVPLDDELEVLKLRHDLSLEVIKEENVPDLPVSLDDCPQLEKQWQDLQRQISAHQQIVKGLRTHLYNLQKPTRQALVRILTNWQELYLIDQSARQWSEDHADDSDITRLSGQILEWIDYWRNSTRIWLAQLLTRQNREGLSHDIWNLALQMPEPEQAADWLTFVETHANDETPDLLGWLDQLEDAKSALWRESSIWRNKKIWSLGWGNFFNDLIHPQVFWKQLVIEVEGAPTNLLDAVSRPFIRDYRRALREGHRGELVSMWFLQLLTLFAIISALLRLAAAVPAALARTQQNLISNVESRALIQLNSALIWLVKPNAPWVIVLLGTNLIAWFIPSHWIILTWVGPIGTMYAVFRAGRVLLEWLISRTFARSGQFVPASTVEKQAQDAHTVSWILLLCFLLWILVKGTGGGYLMFIVVLIDIGLCWGSLMWLMLRYREGVSRFLLFVAGKGSGRKADPAQAQKWWMLPVWPLLFLIAHSVDVVLNLHQKLLVFDTYRSLSIKIMRLRLAAEAKEESEETEEEDALPDQTYVEWMLQDEGKPILDNYALTGLLPTIQHWSKDNSEDNVLLIVGDQGSGKSTLLNKLREKWEDTPVSLLRIPPKTTCPKTLINLIGEHLGLEEPESIADLVKRCDPLDPQVVIIENTQNLFLSEVGYLDAYRTFNQCLNAHLPNIFWVVVMHSASWTYLSCVFNRELRFSNIYRMPRWSPADIRRLILSRHQNSRRRLQYDELLLSASAGSESSSVRAADSRVFNILWEQSSGNPKVAIQLWLAASRSKDKVVEIGVPTKPGANSLKELQDDLCFIYAAIVIHKSLSSDEIMQVTHYAEPIVRHALKQGLHFGLLRRDDSKRYRIEAIWQGTLGSFLASKNMLW